MKIIINKLTYNKSHLVTIADHLNMLHFKKDFLDSRGFVISFSDILDVARSERLIVLLNSFSFVFL